ncbi:MAG: hypothetical protein KC680_01375 [Candidatus Peregrinibacteria bacterium]|nr:hypothetical protein [Candidatus Peregrinibacteria bacterium]MCB9808322.1 hypothetical protein [Candidatus Peribacteria bacterium]
MAPSVPQRTPKMEEHLERMRLIRKEAERLYYESDILSKRGQKEQSYKKKRAADFAMDEWKKENAKYRAKWKQQRRKHAS